MPCPNCGLEVDVHNDWREMIVYKKNEKGEVVQYEWAHKDCSRAFYKEPKGYKW